MLMPSIFGENLFDEFFNDFPMYDVRDMRNSEKMLYGGRLASFMKTDIKELENGYQLEVDLPGLKKEDVKVSLENGYLMIKAVRGLSQDEQIGHYIRRERYAGSCTRSFYVGDDVQQNDVKGEFKHGILTLFVPKRNAEQIVEQNKYIAIEG
ncbi:Hsp20/alpha crystallin family protein [Parablautia sp. Marseille-Q6255]|uniref:Hsp20/alpha crystallin family protein n=1 Tax=Parablautia sp. Marseille-Q6255 TaxID=3039593 RepID=UPI0024BC0CDB|nr:Hsp20/alpha crystallin family protein [Parablautia sp. Marseille-Q6255]